MSADFLIYKQNKINALIAVFNSTKSSLNSQLANNIKIIQKSRLNSKLKQTQINNYISKYNYILSALKNELNANILKINNFIPTVVAIDNTKQKRALLIGINYTGTANELQGCINDVLSVNYKLIQNGFADINIMTDLTPIIPTRNNILTALTTLLESAQSGDSLCFFYSGHGTYTRDNNGDETTGYDQCIVPCDLNIITDDELKAVIQKKLKPNVTLLAMFDSCFSGSVLDLRYSYMDGNNYDKFTENAKESETISTVLMISGCTDNQTSADAVMNNKPNGAMTWALLEALKQTPNCTWRELVQTMRTLLKASQFTQIPLISSGKFESIDTPHFII
jgi:hypothetical protein